ncbi:MAG: glucosaminidase domain-containing protein [Hyphomicrobium sp.]|nr:glucosaminidase domain-containing protein [Hyphomicrobium sp.]
MSIAMRQFPRRLIASSASLAVVLVVSGRVQAAPAIRMSAVNHVPACVTPDRLMAFVSARNPRLDPRFKDIARWYKYWGEAWRVRWDFAFFQMAIETNYLSYRRPDGQRGDVHERQNNFAGIGATGGGVPGNRFPDVATGVHAQIQHLVAYSGERIAQPIAPRTVLAQDEIVAKSLALRRDVTFGDLARRWAVDRNYARSIDAVAAEFRAVHCAGAAALVKPVATRANGSGPELQRLPQPARRMPRDAFPEPSGLGGPKPLQLAGPLAEFAEDLPWLTKTAPATEPPALAEPAAPPAIKPTPKKSTVKKQGAPPNKTANVPSREPVRTIWTREKTQVGGGQRDAPDVEPRATPATATLQPSTDDQPQPQVRPPVDASPRQGAGFFSLPTFLIAPASNAPQPSRLGGPLPVIAAAPAQLRPICRVMSASYGGRKTLLVRSIADGQLRLTALTVHDGFEKSMFETYAKAAAPGAQLIGEYDTQTDALADARMNCDPQ